MHPKVKGFIGKLINNKLPTKKLLQGKGTMIRNSDCVCCTAKEDEDIQHLFLQLNRSKAIAVQHISTAQGSAFRNMSDVIRVLDNNYPKWHQGQTPYKSIIHTMDMVES